MTSPELPPRIPQPCPQRWEDMAGGDRHRFCGECQLHVHNLSALPQKKRAALLGQRDTYLCVSYEVRPDGSMVTPTPWRFLERPWRRLRWALAAMLATVAPFALSACASRPSPLLGRIGPTCSSSTRDLEARRVTGGAPPPGRE